MISDNPERWEVKHSNKNWSNDKWERFQNSYEVFFLKQLPEDLEILEVGCGNRMTSACYYIKYISKKKTKRLVGVDFSEKAIAFASNDEKKASAGKSVEIEYQCINILNKEKMNTLGKFDCVIAFDILEHFSEPGVVLNSLKELLKPKDRIIIATPHAEDPGVIEKCLHQGWGHLSCFTSEGVKELAAECSFKLLNLCFTERRLVFIVEV